MSKPLPPGCRIGILGGGQLGRMLAMAGARLGFITHIFEPAPNPPAADVAAKCWTADYSNHQALHDFANSVDVITFEFENVPAEALSILENIAPVLPNPHALEISQDRFSEKTMLQSIGIKTAPFRKVSDAKTLAQAIAEIGPNGILKTRHLGYDGKGQIRLKLGDNPTDVMAQAGTGAYIFEAFVNFSAEISVIAARSQDEQIVCYDPGENIHRDGILRTTRVPANLPSATKTDAVLIAAKILQELNYVGVMGVEFFICPEGVIVNEFAPRVHNSGHWTQEGSLVDQFEQHIRAVTGLPLGTGKRVNDVLMTNLIGADMEELPALLTDGNCAIHLYGKSEIRPGRKMGHVNRILPPKHPKA